MPGFSISDFPDRVFERDGKIGDIAPSNLEETHRQQRWVISELGPIADLFILPESVQFPDVEIEQLEIKGALLSYKFAHRVSWTDVTITFYDTIDLLSGLNKWRDIIYTNDDGVKTHAKTGGASDPAAGGKGYKHPTKISLLDGLGAVTVETTLHGSWPKKIAHGPLTYKSSELKLITLTLAYDFAEIEQILTRETAGSPE